jgi:class 3 adenylate cyclase
MAPEGGAWHPLTLNFRDTALERRYRAVEDPKAVRMLRIGSLAACVIFLFAGVILASAPDHLVPPGTWMGVALSCAFVLTGYLATFTSWVERHAQFAVAFLSFVFAAYMSLWVLRAPVEFMDNRGFLFLMLHVMNVASLMRLRVVPAAASASAVTGVYLLVMGSSQAIPPLALLRHAFWLVLPTLWSFWLCHQLDARSRREFVAREALDRERARSESLLLNILPAAIAARLKDSQEPIAEHCENATVLFADIVGFTPLSARRKPSELVALLDDVFTRFDALAREHGLEKIKTIGDAYMAVAGLPHAQPDHALRAARMAVAMVREVQSLVPATGEALEVRVGLHSGPVVAGVIGRSKFSYDLWGDTVNTASRMESLGLPGQVQCSPATARCLEGNFALQSRGVIEVKGKGAMETFLVAAAL